MYACLRKFVVNRSKHVLCDSLKITLRKNHIGSDNGSNIRRKFNLPSPYPEAFEVMWQLQQDLFECNL